MLLDNNFRFYMKLAAVFLITLQSYYFYEIGFSAFTLVGFFILFINFLIYKNISFKEKDVKFLFGFFLLVIFSLIGYFTLYWVHSTCDFYFKSLVGFLIVILTIIFIINNFDRLELIKIMFFIISIHIFFFYFQFVSFYAFKHYPDFLYSITGEHQRYLQSGLVRCTGLFNEPATYSDFISIFLLMLCRVSFNLREKIIYFLAWLSIILSFSAMGAVFALIILILFFISKLKDKKKVFYGFIFILLLLVVFSLHKEIMNFLSFHKKFNSSYDYDGRFSYVTNYSKLVYSYFSFLFGPIYPSGCASITLGAGYTQILQIFGFFGLVILCLNLLFFIPFLTSIPLIIFLFIGIPIFIYPIAGLAIGGCYIISRTNESKS